MFVSTENSRESQEEYGLLKNKVSPELNREFPLDAGAASLVGPHPSPRLLAFCAFWRSSGEGPALLLKHRTQEVHDRSLGGILQIRM